MTTSIEAVKGELVQYTYAGNLKAYYNPIQKSGKHPVVIYAYDPFLDIVDIKDVEALKYDLDKHIDTYNSWGYSVFLPVEKYRKQNAIKGAMEWLSKREDVDQTQIHFVGVAHAGFIGLLGLKNYPRIASITLVTPRIPHYTGKFSLPQLMRDIESINCPILMLSNRNDKYWKQKEIKALKRVFMQTNRKASYMSYPYSKRWFWQHDSYFMNDIHRFLTGKQAPITQ